MQEVDQRDRELLSALQGEIPVTSTPYAIIGQQIEMSEKERVYGERYPIDEDFLAALAQMPPASGIALGFDRLVMLATGAARIDQVIWTPVAES